MKKKTFTTKTLRNTNIKLMFRYVDFMRRYTPMGYECQSEKRRKERREELEKLARIEKELKRRGVTYTLDDLRRA